MQEKAVVDAVSLRIKRRRRLSIENHIYRIRLATALRMSEVFLGTLPNDISSPKIDIFQHPNYSGNRYKSHQNSVPVEYLETFFKDISRCHSMHRTIYVAEKKRHSHITTKTGTRRCQILGSMKFKLESERIESSDDEDICIPRNPFPSDDDVDGQNYGQDPKQLFYNKETCQLQIPRSSESNMTKLEYEDKEIFDDDKNGNLKEDLFSDDNKLDIKNQRKEIYSYNDEISISNNAHSFEDNKSDSENNFHKVLPLKEIVNSENSHSSVENKCNFGLHLKETQEEEEKFSLKYYNSAKDVVVINLLQDKICISDDKNKSTEEHLVDCNPLQTTNKNQSIAQNSENACNLYTLVEKENSSYDPQTLNTEMDSAIEPTKHMSNIEIHISQVGNMQIFLNSECTSSENTKIVITEDDVPKTCSVPDFHLHLNDTPEPYTDQSENSSTVTEDQTETQIKVVPISKSVSFPPNKTLYSRFKMKCLRVLRKRRHTCHINKKNNKDKKL